MEQAARTTRFWWYQLLFWTVAGLALFLSGTTQMPLLQAAVRNFFLLCAGFLSSFFLARLIDELRPMSVLRLRLTAYSLAYVVAALCVVSVNAITFTLRGVGLGDLSFGQWFSGTFNYALVFAFWSELFIQQVYVAEPDASKTTPPEKIVLSHGGRLVNVAVSEILSVAAAGDYVEVQTANRTYLDRNALHSLAETLGEKRFPRIHRSRLVNLSHVESVTPLSKGRYQLHLSDGSSATSSRGCRDVVESRILNGDGRSGQLVAH